MEKIESICVMRELIRAMADLESQLQERYSVSPTEAMVLCCIDHDTLTASAISGNIGITPSNTSKVLSSMEKKELINRSIGEVDRRQMQFTLTEKGRRVLLTMKNEKIEIPQFIRACLTRNVNDRADNR